MGENKSIFRTQYDARDMHKRVHVACGDREKIDYQPVYDNRGVWHLEPCGKTNTYLETQSYKDSTDLSVIMARYRNGETDVLQKVQGVYGDFSNFPKNYADVMNMQIQAERMFYQLSAETREKYNNSVEQFMSQLSHKEAWEDLGFKFDQPAPSPATEKEGATE